MDIKGAISDLEKKSLDNLFEELKVYKGTKTLFDMSLHNQCDLLNFLSQDKISTSSETLGLHTNRFLINYLSSAKMFIEHTELTIKKKYGEKSQQFQEWKIDTALEYDNHFAYRFLYQLRNYTQHSGLPIGSISKQLVENNGEETKVLKISFNRDKLLEDSFNWKKLRKEIEDLPEKFLVLDLVNEFNGCMARLYQSALAQISKDLASSIQDYLKLLALYKINGLPFLYKFKNYTDRYNPENYMQVQPLPPQKEMVDCLTDLHEFKVIELNLT